MNDQQPQIVQDRDLARRVAAGDKDAFDLFFHEYFPRLFRFTLGRVNNNTDLAEEVVQRTMCIVVRKMGTYRGEALLFTWLCQICRNEVTAVCRQRRIELTDDVQAALESVATDEHRPEGAHRREEIAHFVRTTLDYLPAKYATALEMKYMHGNSVAEIGAALGIGTKAAESLLTRARVAFKDGFRSLWDFEPGFIVD
jgi:RNA polymerase sigma-70 factor (ECF subfamily)